jgi:PAS domain S-box-containing protein
MDGEIYHDELNKLRLRIEKLNTLVSSRLASQTDDLLALTFENLNNSLEELATVEEQLKSQNEALLEARQEIEDERQRYQDLFDFAPGSYLETDLNGTILEANKPAAFLLNLPQEMLPGRILTNFVDVEERRSFRDILSQARKKISAERKSDSQNSDLNITPLPEMEIRLHPEKKNTFLAAVNTSIVQKGQKKVIRWLIRDVTEQKKTEEALQENEYRFRMLAEKTPLFILVIQNGEIVYANPAACQITGYSPQELIGSDPVDIFDNTHRKKLEFLLIPETKLVENKPSKTHRSDLRVNTRDNQECWIDASAASVVLGGVLSWVLTGYDITKRLKAERDRKNLLQRLVTAQEEERQRISLELHDQLGQDIIALILGLKSVEAGVPEEVNEKVKRLQIIVENLGSELQRLAHDLHPSIIENLGLAEALTTYAEEWSERNQINVDIQTNLKETYIPKNITIAIYRIIQEALTNVLKHSGAKNVSLILDQQAGRLITIVEDDGCGFEIDKVTDKPHKEKKLGLVGMRERAELVGGSLVIESELSQGTSLFLRIPYDHQQGENLNG